MTRQIELIDMLCIAIDFIKTIASLFRCYIDGPNTIVLKPHLNWFLKDSQTPDLKQYEFLTWEKNYLQCKYSSHSLKKNRINAFTQYSGRVVRESCEVSI
jgi:hypothetical protein